jgi:hypothetical protein
MPAIARASEGPEELTFRARKVEADADLRDIALEGDVEIAFGRMRLASEALRLLRRPDGGAVVEGEARLAFCPCPDPPVTIAFGGGEVFPEGDITLQFPRLEVFGVPVLALPWIWLRAPHQAGLFPPSIAWRGRDGLIVGSGVHVPWPGEDGEPRVFQATAAGYLKGGAEVGAGFETPSSRARAALDWLRDTRVELSAQGFWRPDSNAAGVDRSVGDLYRAGAAWDLDAIRGDLARARTAGLAAAARPYDSLAAETSLRIGNRSTSGFLSTDITGRAWRGDGRIAGGPGATLSLSGPLSDRGAWDALFTGSVLRDDQTEAAVALAQGSLGAEMTFRPGPLEIQLSTRERVRAASREPDASADAAASARLAIGLPLVRSFGGAPAPLVHLIEPGLEAQAAVEHGQGSFFRAQWPSDPRFLWTAAAGISTSLGTPAGSGAHVGLRAGLVGLDRAAARPAGHALAAAQTSWISGDLEASFVPGGSAGAPILPFSDPLDSSTSSYAVLARLRAGPPGGVELRADVAAQSGAEASAARIFSGGPLAAAGELLYLARDGLSGLASLAVPWTRWLRTSASAAADITAERLLAVGLGVEIEHPCGCASISASGAHRAGREGIDAILSIDLSAAPPAKNPPLRSPRGARAPRSAPPEVTYPGKRRASQASTSSG